MVAQPRHQALEPVTRQQQFRRKEITLGLPGEHQEAAGAVHQQSVLLARLKMVAMEAKDLCQHFQGLQSLMRAAGVVAQGRQLLEPAGREEEETAVLTKMILGTTERQTSVAVVVAAEELPVD